MSVDGVDGKRRACDMSRTLTRYNSEDLFDVAANSLLTLRVNMARQARLWKVTTVTAVTAIDLYRHPYRHQSISITKTSYAKVTAVTAKCGVVPVQSPGNCNSSLRREPSHA